MTESDFNSVLRSAWPDWSFIRVLGCGTYGTVILAGNGTEESAIKLIFIRGADHPGEYFSDEFSVGYALPVYRADDCAEAVQDCMRHISLLSSLRGHPHIVTLQDSAAIEDEGGCTVLIRMESLKPLSEKMPLSETEVIRMGQHIAEALRALEEKRILHRDIKPDNIFCDEAGVYKLGDFGTSRTVEEERAEITAGRGTPMYMAPEAMRGAACGSRADLYSLGLVMYMLLNGGRGPFLPTEKHLLSSAERIEAQARRLRGEEFPPARHASAEMMRFLRRCCAFRAEDRFRDAADMLSALRILGDERIRRRRGILRRAAAVCAALLAAAGMVYLSIASPFSAPDPPLRGTERISAAESAPLTSGGAILWGDAQLEAHIRALLDKPEGEIYPGDVAHITRLEIRKKEISDIAALAHFTALRELYLDRNRITDIEALSSLTKLRVLNISGNSISDIAALSSLTELERLFMRDNCITDLSALRALTKLRILDFVNNGITDLTPITDAVLLERLKIAGNFISDISVLAGMPYLRELDIRCNLITDFSPLRTLSADCLLSLHGNLTEDTSAAAHVKEIH